MPSSAIGEFVIGESPIEGSGFLEKIVPSYPYIQYSDDDSIQAFVAAQNQYAQAYLDFINDLELPIYTRPQIYGLLLDWVAQGLYGLIRPLLPSGDIKALGPYNTFAFNVEKYNGYRPSGPTNYFATSDDVFKRIITWNFYKGDGTEFNVRWLKRRVQRFLTGPNGTDPGINETYQISVLFAGSDWTIRLLNGIRTVTGGAFYNRFAFNTMAFNHLKSTFQPLTPLALASMFQAAIDAGVLQLPFQYTFTVQVG